MRILHIGLRNLNSLQGDHTVDLTQEPLASAGLFAITGRTGSGKTTLLDAVTLALYGRAARYGSESNPENVMSRHTGECRAEVVFEVPQGRFRAVWERHRARKRPDGQLQPPRRYVYDADERPIAQKIGEADEAIGNLIGLDYDRFLRSALLAQGEFARFLRANANERAELLESLTGTDIYARLSRLAHTEAARRQTELEQKQQHIAAMQILSEDERTALAASIEADRDAIAILEKRLASGEQMLTDISGLESARNRETKAVVALEEIERDREAARDDLERLRKHRAALPFAEALTRLEGAEHALRTATGELASARTGFETSRRATRDANLVLHASLQDALTRFHKAKSAAAGKAAEATTSAEDARAWMEQHGSDAGLAEGMGDLAAAITGLKGAREQVSRLWSRWRASALRILPGPAAALPESLAASDREGLQASMSSFLEACGSHLAGEVDAGRELERQAALREDHLTKSRLLASLEDHRAGLAPGQPCPLCGALEHPWAEEGAAPSVEINTLEEELEVARRTFQRARDARTAFESALANLKQQHGHTLDELGCAIEQQAYLSRSLSSFGVPAPDWGAEDALRETLQSRGRAYLDHVKAEDEAIKTRDAARRSADEASRVVSELEAKRSSLIPLPDRETPPVVAPAGGWPCVSEAEAALSDARGQEATAAARLTDRTEIEERARATLEDLLAPLAKAAADTEFATIEGLRAARLDAEQAIGIETAERALTDRQTSATALLIQARGDIGALVDKEVLEGEAAAAFKNEQLGHKSERDRLLRREAENRIRMKADDDARKRRGEQEKELQKDRAALLVWNRLRGLIGSHDGSKFRRYAQAISLDILTRHANRHLSRLTDRYRIHRDEDGDLNLEVVDLHQAGATRPMASLSGGESFLASLALALGLSDLAGRSVRIDSLFIDEGFGSLDPETLEVAIDALESLRQNRKTVGVISHVELLKERIATQIVLEKRAGGTSAIRVVPEEQSAEPAT